jgi:hypothetical protein
MSKETYPDDFERILSPAEIMAFASEIVWPAVDHLYGGDFRLKAQVLRSTRLRPKTIEIESEHGRERLTIEAQSPRKRTVINENGEQERECWVEITIAELRPELVEGAKDIMDVEIPEDDDLTDEDGEEVEDYGTWWRDDSIDWQPWEVKSFDFTNNKLEPFRTFFDLEVQDEDEDDEHFLWSFTEPEGYQIITL